MSYHINAETVEIKDIINLKDKMETESNCLHSFIFIIDRKTNETDHEFEISYNKMMEDRSIPIVLFNYAPNDLIPNLPFGVTKFRDPNPGLPLANHHKRIYFVKATHFFMNGEISKLAFCTLSLVINGDRHALEFAEKSLDLGIVYHCTFLNFLYMYRVIKLSAFEARISFK